MIQIARVLFDAGLPEPDALIYSSLSRSLSGTSGASQLLLPLHVGEAVGFVHGAGEDEEQVAEAVEVLDELGAKRFGGRELDEAAFGAAAETAGHVELGGGGRAAGKDESAEGGEGGFVVVDGGFQAGDVRLGYARGRFGHGRAGCQLGAEVEERVLGACQFGIDPFRRDAASRKFEPGQAEGGIRFVNATNCFDPQVVLANTHAAQESGFAAVTRSCVNLGHSYFF